jgi:hypothetical protein
MIATRPEPGRDITAIPRAVIAVAVGVVHTVERAVGAGPIRTARDNAWEAVCADLARARQREEVRQRLAARARPAQPGQPADRPGRSVGSSPRSSAAHASALVSAAPSGGVVAPAAPAGRRS